jgi:hypothetical protein
MTLEDRIREEMYVDTGSLLEEQFDRAKEFFEIYEDHTVRIKEPYTEADSVSRMLVHLIAWQYIAAEDEDETPVLPNQYFYDRFDRGESTIRNDFSDLEDEGVIQTTDDSERELVAQRLPEVLDRIDTEIEDKEESAD